MWWAVEPVWEVEYVPTPKEVHVCNFRVLKKQHHAVGTVARCLECNARWRLVSINVYGDDNWMELL